MARVDSQHRTRHHQSAPPRIVDFASPIDWRNGAGRITQQRFRGSEDSSSDHGNFLADLLEK